MSDETLKPCPFCGRSNLIKSHGTQVLCGDCGAMGPQPRRGSPTNKTMSEAKVDAWNMREAVFASPPRAALLDRASRAAQSPGALRDAREVAHEFIPSYFCGLDHCQACDDIVRAIERDRASRAAPAQRRPLMEVPGLVDACVFAWKGSLRKPHLIPNDVYARVTVGAILAAADAHLAAAGSRCPCTCAGKDKAKEGCGCPSHRAPAALAAQVAPSPGGGEVGR